MSSSMADGVLAATHKLVQQAMSGQWQEVPKTVAERRVLLERLSASATPQDQQWLAALRQAMIESDAVVAQMASAGASAGVAGSGVEPQAPSAEESAAVSSVLDMIAAGR